MSLINIECNVIIEVVNWDGDVTKLNFITQITQYIQSTFTNEL